MVNTDEDAYEHRPRDDAATVPGIACPRHDTRRRLTDLTAEEVIQFVTTAVYEAPVPSDVSAEMPTVVTDNNEEG